MHAEGTVIKEGKNVRDAVTKAIRSLGIREDQANIAILSQGTSGFLGLGAKPARVKVSIKEEVLAELKLQDILVDLNISDGVQNSLEYTDEIAASQLHMTGSSPAIPDGAHPAPIENASTGILSGQNAGIAGPVEKRAGSVEVHNGQLIVCDPVNVDLYATVRPDSNVKLTVNGVSVTEETVVKETDNIEIEPVHCEVISSLELHVSTNKMKANLRLVSQPGALYRLKDLPSAEQLVLLAEVESIIEPPELTLEDVKAFLQMKGVIKGIDEEALLQVIGNPNSREPVVIARGLEPVDGIDAYVEYPFMEVWEDDPEEGLFNRNKLISVNEGDVIAVKMPFQTGQDGWAVSGDVIPAKPPKDREICVKGGCQLTENGEKVEAAINGRPVVESGGSKEVIYVDPIFIVKEVSQATGDIKFAGDIEVQGDVRDGCTIEADGNIQVMGDVNRAMLKAGKCVVLHKMVVGSTVVAGGREALYASVIPRFNQIKDLLKKLSVDAKQVLDQAMNSASGNQGISVGGTIQLLLDARFRQLSKTVEELSNALVYAGIAVHEEVISIVKLLERTFCGLNPTTIKSVDLLDDLLTVMEQVSQRIDSYMKREDYIKVRYVQNSSLWSTGDVFIEGQGCYISSLKAGGNVIICGKPGVARGIRLEANGDVTVNDLGSDFETQTSVKTSQNAKITAELIHADVLIQIGREQYRVEQASRDFTAYLGAEGRLVINKTGL